MFFEFWKRQTAHTAFAWDVMEFRETVCLHCAAGVRLLRDAV